MDTKRPTHILNVPAEAKPENEFRQQANAFRQRNRMGRWLKKGGTYLREHPAGEIKGKKALRFAKRQRVAAMKAQNSVVKDQIADDRH